MILYQLAKALVAVVGGVLGLLPDFAIDTDGAMQAVGQWDGFKFLGWANHYLPVTLAVGLLTFRVGLWAVMHGVEAVLWVLTKIHVLGGD